MSMLFPEFPDGPVANFDPDLLESSPEELLVVLGEADAARALAAAALLAAHGNDGGRAILREAVQDDKTTYVALEALRWLEDGECLPWARDILGRKLISPFVQAQAAGLLAEVGEGENLEAGVGHLLTRLKNRKRDDDRGLVIELLGEIGIDEALADLQTIAADDKDPFVGAAMTAVALLDPASIRGRLEALLGDSAGDTDLRCDCVEALYMIDDEASRALLHEIAKGEDVVADLAQGLVED